MKPCQLNFNIPTLIQQNGQVVLLAKEDEPKKKLKYQQARALIGNLIQPLDLRYWTSHPEYQDITILCDEEGMLRYPTPNKEASELLQSILGPHAQNLYGPVIVLQTKQFS